MKANEGVRIAAKSKGIKHWQIAAYLGIGEQTLVRWLRIPLPKEKEAAILAAINAIAAKEGE